MTQTIRKTAVFLSVFIFSIPALAGFLPRSFEAEFADLRGEKEIPVVIKYSFPKKIHYEVKGDAPLLYVCNENKTWKYTPPFMEGEKGELAVGDSAQFCYSRIFDSLSKGLADNKLYAVKTKGKQAVLTFNKSSKKQLGLEKIEITFNQSLKNQSGKKQSGKKSLSLEDAKELKMFLRDKPEPVRLVVKKYTKNPKFDKDQFVFKAPENTNTTRMK